jgi:hypothetical protein
MKMLSLSWFVCGFAATLGFANVFGPADAAPGYGKRSGYGGSYVVAESRFGNGVMRGAVRPTSLGPQVQLPGGSWTYCKRSCSETLRAETVDFWEARRPGGGGDEQGLFIYLGRR